MPSIKAEATQLIKTHLKEMQASAEELGGVFITGIDGAVAVFGVEDSKKKVIFSTSFVSENVNHLLDAQVEMQDLLEDAGIEAISEFDFNLALGVH